MKSFKNVLLVAFVLFSSMANAQLIGTKRINGNYWFPTNQKIQLGNPNAEIYYNGTNLVVDITTGGGSVSFPDGIIANINGIVGDGTPAAGNFTTISASGTITGDFDGIVGGNTPAAGSFTTITASSTVNSTGTNNLTTLAVTGAANFVNISASGSILSTQSTSIGWSVQSAGDTACTSTCTHACVFGQNTADFSIVDCDAATADVCVCAGSN